VDVKSDSAGADSGLTTAQASRAAAGMAGVEVRLSPGGAAELIKLADMDALVQTSTRFSIGASVALCIGGPSPRRLAGRVIRCQVCGIHRDNTMVYQIGIGFDAPTSIDGAEAAADDTPAGPNAAAAASTGVHSEAVALVNEW